MKKFNVLFVLIALFSCNKDDSNDLPEEPNDPIIVITEPNASQLKIVIENLDNIDYSTVTAVSISNQNSIDENGIFDNPYQNNGIEDLPVLLLENEAIIAGYFPHTLTTNKIFIDDILFYFFKSYPRIAIRDIGDNELKSDIQSLDAYEDLKSVLLSSLNSNTSPLSNAFFIQTLQSFTTEQYANRNSDNIVGEFQFEYGREGLVSWPAEVPLFASVGFAIKNTETDEIVFGPELLNTKNLDLNTSSIISWIQTQFGDPVAPLTNSFQFQDDGNYEIVLTNGNSSINDLNQAVKVRNANDITSILFTSVISFVARSLAANELCDQALVNLFNQNFNYALNHLIQGTEPTLEEVKAQLLATGAQFTTSLADCISSNVAFIFFSSIINSALTMINNALDIFEVLSIVKESSIVSNINIQEIRYFNNDISFGELQVTEESQSDFMGLEFDEFQYSKTITEEVVVYDIERSLTSASFVPEVFDTDGAKDLPFRFNIISGDAYVINNEISLTGFDGVFEFNISMGTEYSEIVVSPDFETDVLEETTITLTPLLEDNLFTDAAAVKAILESNSYDVSDPRWTSMTETEVISILEENGCSVTDNNRVWSLNLDSYNLTILPSNIGELSKLQILVLDNTLLTDLPAEIGNLGNNQNFSHLLCNNCQLSTIPQKLKI